MRSYDDLCGIARALNAVGERWALLVVRELVFGPKRFTDLRAGLPGVSDNVLSQRLRELEGAAVVRRYRLGPPSRAQVYELTPHGEGLVPVLLALGRWGSRIEPPAGAPAELSVDALAFALRTTFDPAAAGDLRVTCHLSVGDDEFTVEVADGGVRVARGAPARADVTLTTGAPTLQGLVFAGGSLSAAERAGAVAVHGRRAVAARLLRCFPRSAPADTTHL